MKWRYIPPFSASGSIQMAVDSWLFHQCHQGYHPPTLRFYTWFPATLSLGYFQKRWPEHWSDLTWHGQKLTIVRRPSGGRGVLHHGDLTYSLICPIKGYTRSEAYAVLCQFLIRGWEQLGLPLNFGTTKRGYHHETNCFRLATSADLVCDNNHKFIGSAQLWRGQTLLQHGSMALQPDLELQALVFGKANHQPQPQCPWNKTPPSLTTTITTLKQAAQETLELQLDCRPLSNREWDDIAHYIPRTVVD